MVVYERQQTFDEMRWQTFKSINIFFVLIDPNDCTKEKEYRKDNGKKGATKKIDFLSSSSFAWVAALLDDNDDEDDDDNNNE